MMNVNLTIDAQLTVQLIKAYLQELVKTQQSDGILLGLSGGIDSSVLLSIAVRAVGKDRVHASFLYDRDSEKESEKKALIMANWLDIGLDIFDISPAMKKKNIYDPLIMKLIPYSPLFNRLIQHSYRFINGEVPFKTSLKIGSNVGNGSWIKSLMYNFTIRHIDRGFAERHIYRRELLNTKATQENLILIGAANRSEFEVGWFVKDGVDDLPIQPMTGLYKTQVWQLASYLKLPDEIQNQLASPDMMFGITDEFGIGHNYRKLDVILDMMEREKTDEEMVNHGICKADIEDVRELMLYSEWKRNSLHETPPVQGGVNGNVRSSNMNSS
ncbi:NAD(+) synthase [Shewanella atlantica]|uniref:NH(3)-dependent NAD(+) synthetase n=2 Tax=Shewanella atlantica TaxID=271099 RepID=A0A3S0KSG8_9GAMM|nr:NAD(+) synthase [Shewanella atlantica]